MVYLILDLLAGGKSFDEIITDYYPDITTDDIRACLEYASQVVRDEDVIPVA